MSTPKALSTFFLFILSTISLSLGQGKNFGLTNPQSPEMLPQSAVAIINPIRKAKTKLTTALVPVKAGEYLLTNGWELAENRRIIASEQNLFSNMLNTQEWYNATVPGTVLTTLVDQGVYPDPYFGINNLAIPDSLSRTDWWYRISFDLPKEATNKNVWLLFNGINYRAEIWLNGKVLGNINGAFVRGEFNATSLLKSSGQNILAVHILPPPNPGIPHEESARTGQGPNGGTLCLDGPTFISSEGWDWIPGIRDRNIGIWQDVRIRFTGGAQLSDTQIITDLPLPDLSSANLIIKTEVINTATTDAIYTVEGKIEDIVFTQLVNVKAGQSAPVTFSPEQFKQLTLKNPRLWWPNGYGEPSLYILDIQIKDAAGAISDVQSLKFGIRELSYEMSVDMPNQKGKRIEFNPTFALKDGLPLFDNVNRREVMPEVYVPQLRKGIDPELLPGIADTTTAPYLVFKVNGKRIFCKGGNWGMDDGMKRVSRERLEPYIRLHRDANYNMVRNWTAETTEEEFYNLCDEYGMLVWNDFWLSTEGWNLDPSDQPLSIANAKDVIVRFRNHPSIVVWCPRNEGYAPEGLEDAFAKMVAQEDGTRLYQGNSRFMNLRPSGPWHYFKNPADYYVNNAQGFSTEIGTFSIPTATTIRKFMAKEDQWPIGDVWFYHDLHREQGLNDYLGAIDSLYGKAKNLDDFCKKAQLVNYNSHRAIFEAWNSKLWKDGTGVLLWMTHPAWPSMIWQTYSWDYETHGSYFGSKKACEPIHIQMNLHDNKVVASNASLQDLTNAKVSFKLSDLNGKLLVSKEQKLNIPANQLTDIFTPTLPETLPEVYLVRLTITNAAGSVLSMNEYLKTSGKNFQSLNTIPEVQLTGTISYDKSNQNKLILNIKNTNGSSALAIKLSLVDKQTNVPLLPAYFSDGYFNLLPGETRQITVENKNISKGGFKILTEGYNVSGSFDIKYNGQKWLVGR